MNKERKSVRAEIKQAGDKGAFEAIIATLGVVDSDGDIIAPGAFGDAVVTVQPAHDARSVPLGKARIEERGDKAVAVGNFNLDIPTARDWHSALKFDLDHPPSIQEWSFGFFVKKAGEEVRDGKTFRVLQEMDSIEVSPVLRGAGKGTGTVAVKEATPRHQTDTSNAPWDGPANERRLEAPLSRAQVNNVYAWVDTEAEGDDGFPKTAARFIHHFVDSDGNHGSASTRAATTGIAVLNGARGGTTIPDGDRQAVWDHLAGHLRDADIEPPELRSAEACAVKLIEEIRMTTNEVEVLVEKIRNVSAARAKSGGHVSPHTLEATGEMLAAFGEMERLSKIACGMIEARDPESQIAKAISAWEVSKAKALG